MREVDRTKSRAQKVGCSIVSDANVGDPVSVIALARKRKKMGSDVMGVTGERAFLLSRTAPPTAAADRSGLIRPRRE